MSRSKPSLPPLPVPKHTCTLRVAPFVMSAGTAKDGGGRWTWAGPEAEPTEEGPAFVPCGYQTYTEDAMLAHLVVTHQIQLAHALGVVA